MGTGINAHPRFAARAARYLSVKSGLELRPNPNYFEALSSQDTAVELSGQLRTLAVSLMKIANDLRWMNSGPLAGLGEIALPALQPGSSIMPGKVNPVIPEAVTMVAAQVIGNDATIAIAGQSGNFQLNVMLPVIAYNLLQSIELLANAARVLADSAIAGLHGQRSADRRGARAQSDSGHGAQSRDRLRARREDRQAGLCGGPTDPRGRRRADGLSPEELGDCSTRARSRRPAARARVAVEQCCRIRQPSSRCDALIEERLQDSRPPTDPGSALAGRILRRGRSAVRQYFPASPGGGRGAGADRRSRAGTDRCC